MRNLKVFIVDDEMLSRAGVRSCIDWQEQGFELVGEAENGRQALEKIAVLKPDVVFTDIEMPVMDGIQLTRTVLTDQPRMKVVVLSCHSDFEYVKEAMKLGAFDYLLKLSMKPKDLTALLKRLKADLEEEERRQRKEKLRKSEIEEKLSLLKEGYLRNLLLHDSPKSEEDFRRKRDSLDLHLDYHHNSVIALQIENLPGAGNARSPNPDSDCTDICRRILSEGLKGELCALGKDRYGAIVSFDGDTDAAERKGRITRFAVTLNRVLKEEQDLSLSAGVSHGCLAISACSSLYDEACRALDGRFFTEGRYLGFHDPRHTLRSESINIGLDFERALVKALELSAEEECFAVLAELSAELAGKREYAPGSIVAACKEVLYLINRTVKSIGGDLSEYLREDPLVRVSRLDRFVDLSSWLVQVTRVALSCIDACKNRRYRAEIVRVLDYIRADLGRNVALKEAARVAGLSEKYFCKVFKEETGKNYIDYMQGLKIEKAIELLKNQDTRIYEVAFSLGFENESYFCKRFKQYMGQTAHEFRQSLQRNG